MGYSCLTSGLGRYCLCRVPPISWSPSRSLSPFSRPPFPSLWWLRVSRHIKWRAAPRFQFRTHLWRCRPPTRSAVAEGTQGSPITALYANVFAPGQQRGHAATGSSFMQIWGGRSQHNTERATDTGGHISPTAQLWKNMERCEAGGEPARRCGKSNGWITLINVQHERDWKLKYDWKYW